MKMLIRIRLFFRNMLHRMIGWEDFEEPEYLKDKTYEKDDWMA